MDVEEIRNLVRRPSSRSKRIGLAACLLVVPILWSVRQAGMTREALDRATAAEKNAAQARMDMEQTRAQIQAQARPPKDPAIRRSRHDDPREIARVKELYEEINGLSQAGEHVDQKLRTDRLYVPKNRPAPR